MSVAISDVAKKVGVSISTASLALRGKPRVSEKTRMKVLQTARELGYTANALASSLKSGRKNLLGVAIYDATFLGGDYIGGILGGIAQITDMNKYGIMFAQSKPLEDAEAEYIRIAKAGRIDGTILIDQAAPKSELKIYSQTRVPLVLVDREVPVSYRMNSVCFDYRSVVAEATSYLIKLGHRRIVAVTNTVNYFEYREKFGGYVDAFEDNGLEQNHNWLINWDETRHKGKTLDDIVRYLLDLPQKPTACLCLWDEMLVPLCEVLRKYGVRIPEDMSIIGFESITSGGSIENSIGAIRVPVIDAGKHAARMLIGSIEDNENAQKITLYPAFEPRQTCAKPPSL